MASDTTAAERRIPPDAGAFCASVHPRLVAALTAQTGQRALAQELAQEALARAYERWDRVRGMESPVGWTYRVAFNLARSRWRRAAAERRAIDRLPPTPQPGDLSTRSVERLELRAALDALPRRQREAVALRYLGDLSIEDASVALGCRPGTVRSLTAQGIARLRDQLRDQGDEEHEEVHRA